MRVTTAMSIDPSQITESSDSQKRPEFFPIPKRPKKGEDTIVDPYFGLSASSYYKMQSKGAIKLYKIQPRGFQRAIKVLIKYDEILSVISVSAAETSES